MEPATHPGRRRVVHRFFPIEHRLSRVPLPVSEPITHHRLLRVQGVFVGQVGIGDGVHRGHRIAELAGRQTSLDFFLNLDAGEHRVVLGQCGIKVSDPLIEQPAGGVVTDQTAIPPQLEVVLGKLGGEPIRDLRQRFRGVAFRLTGDALGHRVNLLARVRAEDLFLRRDLGVTFRRQRARISGNVQLVIFTGDLVPAPLG